MSKVILFLIVIIFISANISKPQDSLRNTFNVERFNLTSENYYGLSFNGSQRINQNLQIEFSDCNKISILNDSCFNLYHKSEKYLLYYFDITKIAFYVKRRTFEGIWKGGLTGGLGELFLMTVLKNNFFPARLNEGGGGPIYFLIYESAFILTGAAIGGTIGYFSFDTVDYDISKYPPKYRKNAALNLFLKYKLNL